MAEAAEDASDFVAPATTDAQKAPNEKGAPVKKRNAFLELMAPKPKASKSDAPVSHSSKPPRDQSSNWSGRRALLEYIQRPDHFPQQVLKVTPNTVLIQDAFPKATIHLLLLPRDPAHYDLNPRDAFDDAEFLAMVRDEAASAVKLAAQELARRLSCFSASSEARNKAIDAGVPTEELPVGRDYISDIRVGVHAHPSMHHLHVHIFSRDMHSDCLKHRKHYNSFNTPFLIPLDDFPLAPNDERRSTPFQNANLKRSFECWRCGKDFGNKFAELKKHLVIEFELWKKE
ncbi:HIT-like domain-containing protein [Podospora didyma]|uniref:Aprataxin-like protein n=1 Tax=Podospora didyma TaxID=330526 RepID=A0AAE0U4Z4_9PEZI|nr:HIT-like domain-containing protein [Podospora didyma]